MQLSPDKSYAMVNLASSVNRNLVPSQDFVLLIRDSMTSEPSVISTSTPSEYQAISINIFADMRSNEEKERVIGEIQESLQSNSNFIDVDPNVTYS